MSKEARDHRWHVRNGERLTEAGVDPVKLERIWMDTFTRGKPKWWQNHIKMTITVVSATMYNMSASTGYYPLGARWPFISPKRTPLIRKGGKPC